MAGLNGTQSGSPCPIAHQVDRYLRAYSKKARLPSRELAACASVLAAAQQARRTAPTETAISAFQAYMQVCFAFQPYVLRARTAISSALHGSRPSTSVLTQALIGAYPRACLPYVPVHIMWTYLHLSPQAASALAKRKFTRFNLPAMVVGAMLSLAAALALPCWLAWR